MIEKNSDFVIVGESIANGDVILKRKGKELKRVAFSGGKLEQLRMIEENLSSDIWVVSLASSAIPYAFERGDIDGAVLDSSKYSKLKGEYEIIPYEGNYITYVLVMKKSVISSKEFKNFIKIYNKVISEKNSETTIEKEEKKWKPTYIPIKLEE